MKRPVLAALAALMLSTGALAAPSSASARSVARGDFTVAVDFTSATLTELGANACKLTIDATIQFTGTLVGPADGTTVALIAAGCDAVATSPPGTFADVFAFAGDFAGTVDGTPVDAKLRYAGATRAGGEISAVMALTRGARGLLKVDAEAGVGGSYVGLASA